MSTSRIMIVAAVLIVVFSLVMVYLYGEHFANRDAVPTAISQPEQNNSATIRDY